MWLFNFSRDAVDIRFLNMHARRCIVQYAVAELATQTMDPSQRIVANRPEMAGTIPEFWPCPAVPVVSGLSRNLRVPCASAFTRLDGRCCLKRV